MAEKKYRISRKTFPQFSYYSNEEYYVHVITDMVKELFGKDIVKYAWLVLDEVKRYPDERPNWEKQLSQMRRDWEKNQSFYFDTYDVIIELKNGNIVRTSSSEWGSFQKGIKRSN